jgi:CBS domain-containing protein
LIYLKAGCRSAAIVSSSPRPEALMNIADIMSRKVIFLSPSTTVKAAADAMRLNDVGILPVLDGERMVGIVTDRDIVLRVVALGVAPEGCPVGDIMTEEVHYCRDDDVVDEVARRLGELRIRRMPVVDEVNRLVGLISLDDIAAHVDRGGTIAYALRRIAALA